MGTTSCPERDRSTLPNGPDDVGDHAGSRSSRFVVWTALDSHALPAVQGLVEHGLTPSGHANGPESRLRVPVGSTTLNDRPTVRGLVATRHPTVPRPRRVDAARILDLSALRSGGDH